MAKFSGLILPLISIVLSLTLISCESTSQRDDRVYRFLDEISFGGPFDHVAEKNGTLARWDEPMRVYFQEGTTPDIEALVTRYLDRFSRLTGVPVDTVREEKSANVTVAFAEQPDFLVNREFVSCYVHMRWNDRKVTKGKIEISLSDPEKLERCIAHELMHTFGFRYHSGIVRSILSAAHNTESLTEWDELALQILYDPQIEPGITREEAAPLFRALVSQALN